MNTLNPNQQKKHHLYLKGFETERLKLRKLEIADIDHWQPFYQNNPSLKYLNFQIIDDQREMSKRWIETQLERYKSFSFGHLALIDIETQEFVGQSGIISREVEGIQEWEIAYSILPAMWGKGFASEASNELIKFAFENQITNRLISIIQIDNLASQKVATKNLMTKSKKIAYPEREVFIFELTDTRWRDPQTQIR